MPKPLLSPIVLSSSITLRNRVVMAPMTRRFSDKNSCPVEQAINYYSKRSDTGLIITEGTLISEDAIGYGNIPGIYTENQIAAWEKVTRAVHDNGGKIFLQIWHCGRVSHSHFHNGKLPISASETVMTTALGNSGFQCETSRAASLTEIEALIQDYGRAAVNARKAGFDGVEIHGANGYLVDQFLHHCTNKRTDSYGGSYQNMAKFCLDVVKECGEKIGLDRVGLRLSPAGHMAEIETHPDDKFVFSHLLEKLNAMPLCYVHTGNFDDSVVFNELDGMTMTGFIRKHYKANVIASGGYNILTSSEFCDENRNNLVAFGRPFLANPNLITLMQTGQKWIEYNKQMLETLE